MISGFFLNSLLLQRVMGLSALGRGLVFLPVAAAGFALAAIGMALLGGIPAGDDAVTGVLPGFVLAAAGLGMALVTATTTALSRIDPRRPGLVSGVVTTAHELGAALGVAIASTLAGAILAGLAAVATSRLEDPGRQAPDPDAWRPGGAPTPSATSPPSSRPAWPASAATPTPASLRSPRPPGSAESPCTATSPPARSSWTPSSRTPGEGQHGAASEALSRLIRSSWPILARHRGLLDAAQHDLPPARIRQHHDQTMARVERLIARGQDEGDLRTDLPRPWLVATFYSLMHAAAEEVNAGRLDPATVPHSSYTL